ncbi:type II toxin-antitoxin system VapC family toxin [Brevundimonas basaltis]|uniref:PIN domain nuclease of toxin-antitoxin system n=1 Tax=Brevundimonas basaltis TaxID=472166 RepID=A0A7W8HWS6_9CAUL|nr:PIN domain nuclease of toxin-antitoxin system [Brevundimonas basaltis]
MLLDTHALVWSALLPSSLSARARDLISDPDNDRMVSTASAYEIEYKRRRDPELSRLPTDLDELRHLLVFEWLPIDEGHATRAGRLPEHHRDPWDRIIVAQALAENLTLISADRALPIYGTRLEW